MSSFGSFVMGKKIAIAVFVLALSTMMAFALGRSTAPSGSTESEISRQDITANQGAVVRVPDVELLCSVAFEISEAMFLCNRTGDRPRFQIVFYRNRTTVGRIGDPGDQRVFAERP
jgi:hypothetical protein